MLRIFLKNRVALTTLGVSVCVAGCVPAGSPPRQPTPVVQPPRTAPPLSVVTPMVTPGKRRDQPPADLLNALQALASGFQGRVGIAIRDVDDGWAVGYNADAPLPQQSVSKLWVAIAVMDAIDRGTLSLSDAVTVRHADLTVFHQPIRALVGKDG
jgi:beta-lactamase class A